MEGFFGGQEYVIYYIHIGLTFGVRWSGFAVCGSAEGAQGAELSQRRIFEYINKSISVEQVHRARE